MIPEFVKAWDERKDALREFIHTHNQSEYDEYEKLVRILFDVVTNPSIENKRGRWNTAKIHVIDDGDYQGTQLFIIPRDVYQPNNDDYVVTCQGYGSCSGCDLLLGISSYDSGLPDDEQVKEYMTLLLHLLQRCKMVYDNYEC